MFLLRVNLDDLLWTCHEDEWLQCSTSIHIKCESNHFNFIATILVFLAHDGVFSLLLFKRGSATVISLWFAQRIPETPGSIRWGSWTVCRRPSSAFRSLHQTALIAQLWNGFSSHPLHLHMKRKTILLSLKIYAKASINVGFFWVFFAQMNNWLVLKKCFPKQSYVMPTQCLIYR